MNWHNACDVQGHVLRTSYALPVLYSYFNSFCISDVQHVWADFSHLLKCDQNL